MDPRNILDYAMFQLTPTRTRCDLVVYSAAVKEKMASGLFEPFVSHLKFVNDEISKGGYSIKLLPPTKGSPWFSKATFERFVCFVSSPAILERFVSLEREIRQTENSYEANKLSISNSNMDEEIMSRRNGDTRSSSDSTKLNNLLEGANNKEEENSKVALQHLLESRIAILRREQAMAYARGLVAGFQYENIDDLIHFANAFGASRLREACINFKELWKKKHVDDMWIEEVAAVQSCLTPAPSFSEASGIVLANEIPAPHQDGKINNSTGGAQNGSLETPNRKDQIPSHIPNGQIPMPWQYNIPPYMYNLQSPLQQMPSFQGYPLANMQSVPPYLPNNPQWPSNHKDSNGHRNHKSSGTRKEKSPYKNGSGDFEDSQSESSNPDSGSKSNSENEQEQKPTLKVYKKKNGTKQPSRRIIIRNINYIASKRRNGDEESVSDVSCTDEEDLVNEDCIKQNVDIALESLQKVHKSERHANGKIGMAQGVSGDADDQDPTDKNENWNVFQNLLKIDDKIEIDEAERRQPVDILDEHFIVQRTQFDGVVLKQPKVANDSFIVPDRDGGNEGSAKLGEYVDGCGPVTKIRDNLVEDIVFSHRMTDSGSNRDDPLSSCFSNSAVNKNRNSEDWFVADHSDKTINPDPPFVPKIFDGDYISSSTNDVSRDEKGHDSTPIDDSFMIQGQLIDDSPSDSHWKTDVSIVADLTPARKLEKYVAVSCDKHDLSRNEEPNDLCVVLQRDLEMESVAASWTMNNEIDFSFSETDGRSCISDSHVVNKKPSASPKKTNASDSQVPATKKSGKDDRSKPLHGSLWKGKSEIMSRNKKLASPMSRPLIQKSKLEKEEEIRKKMEEMVLERQRRIAERTAASGLARAATKKDQLESKTARGSTRSDKIIHKGDK